MAGEAAAEASSEVGGDTILLFITTAGVHLPPTSAGVINIKIVSPPTADEASAAASPAIKPLHQPPFFWRYIFLS